MTKKQAKLTLITTAQAAKVLTKALRKKRWANPERTAEHIYHYVRVGQLPVVSRVGTALLFDPDVVAAFKPNPVGHPIAEENKSPAAKRSRKKTCDTKRKGRGK